jgi:WD40 repeat protein
MPGRPATTVLLPDKLGPKTPTTDSDKLARSTTMRAPMGGDGLDASEGSLPDPVASMPSSPLFGHRRTLKSTVTSAVAVSSALRELGSTPHGAHVTMAPGRTGVRYVMDCSTSLLTNFGIVHHRHTARDPLRHPILSEGRNFALAVVAHLASCMPALQRDVTQRAVLRPRELLPLAQWKALLTDAIYRAPFAADTPPNTSSQSALTDSVDAPNPAATGAEGDESLLGPVPSLSRDFRILATSTDPADVARFEQLLSRLLHMFDQRDTGAASWADFSDFVADCIVKGPVLPDQEDINFYDVADPVPRVPRSVRGVQWCEELDAMLVMAYEVPRSIRAPQESVIELLSPLTADELHDPHKRTQFQQAAVGAASAAHSRRPAPHPQERPAVNWRCAASSHWFPSTITAFTYIPKMERRVVVSCADLSLRVTSLRGPRPPFSYSLDAGDSYGVLHWSPQWQKLYGGGSNGGISVFSMPPEPSVATPIKCSINDRVHTSTVTHLQVLTTDGSLLSASMDPRLVLQDPTRHAIVAEFAGGHRSAVRGVTHLVDYGAIASCGFDPEVFVWSLHGQRRGGSGVTTINRPIVALSDPEVPHRPPLVAVHWVPNTPQLLSLDAKGLLKVWDLRTYGCAQNVSLSPSQTAHALAGGAEATLPALAAGGGGGGGGSSSTSSYTGAAFVAPHGTLLAYTSHNIRPVVYSQRGSNYVRETADEAIMGIRYSAASDSVISATPSALQVFELRTAVRSRELPFAAALSPGDAALPDVTSFGVDAMGRRAVIGHRGGLVSFYATAGGRCLGRYQASDSDILDTAGYGSDGVGFAIDDAGSVIIMSHTNEALPPTRLERGSGAKFVRTNAAGHMALVFHGSLGVHVYSFRSGDNNQPTLVQVLDLASDAIKSAAVNGGGGSDLSPAASFAGVPVTDGECYAAAFVQLEQATRDYVGEYYEWQVAEERAVANAAANARGGINGRGSGSSPIRRRAALGASQRGRPRPPRDAVIPFVAVDSSLVISLWAAAKVGSNSVGDYLCIGRWRCPFEPSAAAVDSVNGLLYLGSGKGMLHLYDIEPAVATAVHTAMEAKQLALDDAMAADDPSARASNAAADPVGSSMIDRVRRASRRRSSIVLPTLLVPGCTDFGRGGVGDGDDDDDDERATPPPLPRLVSAEAAQAGARISQILPQPSVGMVLTTFGDRTISVQPTCLVPAALLAARASSKATAAVSARRHRRGDQKPPPLPPNHLGALSLDRSAVDLGGVSADQLKDNELARLSALRRRRAAGASPDGGGGDDDEGLDEEEEPSSLLTASATVVAGGDGGAPSESASPAASPLMLGDLTPLGSHPATHLPSGSYSPSGMFGVANSVRLSPTGALANATPAFTAPGCGGRLNPAFQSSALNNTSANVFAGLRQSIAFGPPPTTLAVEQAGIQQSSPPVALMVTPAEPPQRPPRLGWVSGTTESGAFDLRRETSAGFCGGGDGAAAAAGSPVGGARCPTPLNYTRATPIGRLALRDGSVPLGSGSPTRPPKTHHDDAAAADSSSGDDDETSAGAHASSSALRSAEDEARAKLDDVLMTKAERAQRRTRPMAADDARNDAFFAGGAAGPTLRERREFRRRMVAAEYQAVDALIAEATGGRPVSRLGDAIDTTLQRREAAPAFVTVRANYGAMESTVVTGTHRVADIVGAACSVTRLQPGVAALHEAQAAVLVEAGAVARPVAAAQVPPASPRVTGSPNRDATRGGAPTAAADVPRWLEPGTGLGSGTNKVSASVRRLSRQNASGVAAIVPGIRATGVPPTPELQGVFDVAPAGRSIPPQRHVAGHRHSPPPPTTAAASAAAQPSSMLRALPGLQPRRLPSRAGGGVAADGDSSGGLPPPAAFGRSATPGAPRSGLPRVPAPRSSSCVPNSNAFSPAASHLQQQQRGMVRVGIYFHDEAL